MVVRKTSEGFTATGAEPRTILAAERGHGKLEDKRVTKDGLEVDQIVDQERKLIVVIREARGGAAGAARVRTGLGIAKQLLKIDGQRRLDRIQAAAALAAHDRP